MPLVDYGSSDESDSEENNDQNEDEEVKSKDNDNSANETLNNKTLDKDDSDNGTLHNKSLDISVNEPQNKQDIKLFSNLPTPKCTFSIPDNTFKLLNKKQPVKIVLPSLSELDKSIDEKDQNRKPKPSSKGSGLFALLPAPKYSKPLIPDSVKNKVKPISSSPKPLVPKQIKKPIPSPLLKNSTKSVKPKDEEDDDDETQPESFFFTSTDDVQPDPIEPIEIPSLTSSNTVNNAISKSFGYNDVTSTQPESSSLVVSEPSQPMEVGNDLTDLEPEAIEKLCGTRARKRKGEIPEEVIDINVDSMVGDAYMWLSKDLTKEREHGSFKKAKNLSVTERRKHQITYLASQAKEKEMELRNQWANSRMTRQQTQSKYGF